MASTNFVGTLSELNPSKEQWSNYQKRLEIWMKANVCAGEDKATIFLALIGAEAFEAVSNYVSPAEPTDKTYAQLTEILQKHYQPAHSEISVRLQFRSRKQQPNEGIAEYILDLKKLSKRYGYGAELDVNLRDTFVGGLRSDKLQANLLLKGNDLTWKIACQRALDWEISQKDSKHLQGETTQADVNKVGLEKKKRNRNAMRRNATDVWDLTTPKSALTSNISVAVVPRLGTCSEPVTCLVQRERKTNKENRKEMERGLIEGVDFVASKRTNLAELTW